MDPINRANAVSAVHGLTAAPPAVPPPSPSLTQRTLSRRALAALDKKEATGSTEEKHLAGLAKDTIGRGQWQRQFDSAVPGMVGFQAAHYDGVLVVHASLDERQEYNVHSVIWSTASGSLDTMTLLSPLETLPQELMDHVLDHLPDGGPGSRATALPRASKRLFERSYGQTRAKVTCTDLVARVGMIDTLTVEGRVGESHHKRYVVFKAAYEQSQSLPDSERLEVLGALGRALPKLSLQAGSGFGLMMTALSDLIRWKQDLAAKSPLPEGRLWQCDDATVALAKGLTAPGVAVYVTSETRDQAYDTLCSALLEVDANHQARHVGDLCPHFADTYWREGIGGERFDRLVQLAGKFGPSMSSDRLKQSLVYTLLWQMRDLHEPGVDVTRHVGALRAIVGSLENEAERSRLLAHVDSVTGPWTRAMPPSGVNPGAGPGVAFRLRPL